MSPSKNCLAVVVGFVLITVLCTAAGAQEDRSVPAAGGEEQTSSAAALPGVFSEVLDVRVINLEVVVTDRKGTQIRGLTPSDFRLLVDGEETAIDYFTEVRSGAAVADRSGAEAGGDPPGVPELTPGEAVGTSYLVFIDDFFGLKVDRNAVLQSLKDELPYLRPEDRMAIVAYDGKRLEMLSTWSSLQRPLERALDEAMFRPARGLERIVERRRYDVRSLDQFNFGSPTQDPADLDTALRASLSPEERYYVGQLTEQLNRSIAAAAATLRSFAKPPGRKVMLLLSGGWPFVPADYLVSDVSRILFDREGPYGSNLYRRLVETANVLGYTLYPVDLPGLDRNLSNAALAEIREAPLESRAVGSSAFEREGEAHATLRYLADETGGQALINAQRIGALGTVARDVDSYYWLGFTPVRARDDASHEVVIELTNPDFVSRARSSYLDSSQEREVSMAVESTLLFGNAAAAGTVRVDVGTPVEVAKKRMEVAIKVAIPLSEVTILPMGQGFFTQLELRVAVQDDSGQQAPIPVIPWNLTFEKMPPAGAFGTFQTKLLLRRTDHEAVVAVHDPASGRIFSTGFGIVPPAQ